MIDITKKFDTLRIAIAMAELKVSAKSIAAIKNDIVPKGNVFASAKIAGLLSVKNTSNTLPHCHPIPVEFTNIDFKINGKNRIEIFVEVKTIYKTGCEMEALHGVSVAALTVYDMLKPIDEGIEIRNIRLLQKSGGKSDLKSYYEGSKLSAAIVIISDSVNSKKNKDESGKLINEMLKEFNIKVKKLGVVPDEIESIQAKIRIFVKNKVDLIITTGGTGLSERDVTYEAVNPLIEKEISGVMEAARAYGQNRTPYAMLSRGVAGFVGNTLVLTFPGSPKGVKEYMDSLFPQVLHLFKVRKDFRH